MPLSPPAKRKTYSRRVDIPASLLKSLNAGLDETRTLSEWLMVNHALLAKNVFTALGYDTFFSAIDSKLKALSSQGVMTRLTGTSQILYTHFSKHKKYPAILKSLSTHRSDIVRSWAAYMISFDTSLSLRQLIKNLTPFAADHNMGVRECVWMALRPVAARNIARSVKLLEPLSRHKDFRVRRFAIEVLRPRGVWCSHITELRKNPRPILPLLHNVRSDPEDYVRRSCANWLNDASKDHPDFVLALTARWSRESPTRETHRIVTHATRTLRKRQRT